MEGSSSYAVPYFVSPKERKVKIKQEETINKELNLALRTKEL